MHSILPPDEDICELHFHSSWINRHALLSFQNLQSLEIFPMDFLLASMSCSSCHFRLENDARGVRGKTKIMRGKQSAARGKQSAAQGDPSRSTLKPSHIHKLTKNITWEPSHPSRISLFPRASSQLLTLAQHHTCTPVFCHTFSLFCAISPCPARKEKGINHSIN